VVAPQQAIELASVWQTRKQSMEMRLSEAVKVAFAAETLPLAEQTQCDHLATAQRRRWTGTNCSIQRLQSLLAKVVNHDV
jgi:hypothetical protein